LEKEGVSKAAVIAVKDEKWGERPLALIVVLPEFAGKIGKDEIRAHVASYVEKGVISQFAVPERVSFVDTLPLTSIGKIDKKKLRAAYREELAYAGSPPTIRVPPAA
jgi:fatty-acyl-CoA synthase